VQNKYVARFSTVVLKLCFFRCLCVYDHQNVSNTECWTSGGLSVLLPFPTGLQTRYEIQAFFVSYISVLSSIDIQYIVLFCQMLIFPFLAMFSGQGGVQLVSAVVASMMQSMFSTHIFFIGK